MLIAEWDEDGLDLAFWLLCRNSLFLLTAILARLSVAATACFLGNEFFAHSASANVSEIITVDISCEVLCGDRRLFNDL
jgi:hypothetical protein